MRQSRDGVIRIEVTRLDRGLVIHRGARCCQRYWWQDGNGLAQEREEIFAVARALPVGRASNG